MTNINEVINGRRHGYVPLPDGDSYIIALVVEGEDGYYVNQHGGTLEQALLECEARNAAAGISQREANLMALDSMRKQQALGRSLKED